MNIDRHNYEEQFILYWDNELGAGQKKMVEEFVLQNPDLEPEFRLLGNSRFSPTEILPFNEKEMLLKEASVHPGNYESWFILYVDEELTKEDRQAVEEFVEQHPSTAEELSLLKKTVSVPDAKIIFPDKSILFRKTTKPFVISLAWYRVAIAAAVLLIAGFFTIRLISTGRTEKEDLPIVTSSGQIQPKPGVEDPIPDRTTNVQKDEFNSGPEKTNIRAPKDKKDAGKNIYPQQIENRDQNIYVHNQAEPVIKNSDAQAEIVALNKPNDQAIAKLDIDVSPDPLTDNDVTKSSAPSLNDRMIPGTESGLTDEVVKDGGGIRGLLRKATRVFERRTNIQATTDDNKLLLGAFAVSLK